MKSSHAITRQYNEEKGMGEKRLNLMERRGSGLRNIFEAYEFEENYTEESKPEIRSTGIS